MKPLVSLFMGLLLTCSATSQAQETNNPTINPNAVVTKKYSIDPFSAITSSMIGELYIKSGSDWKVETNGTFETVNLLRIISKEGTLYIETEKKKLTTKKLKSSQITITVTTPTLYRVTNQGVNNLTIEGEFTGDTLTIESKGVGNIQARNLQTKELSIHSEGVGDVKVEGESKRASYSSTGVGNINAKGLLTQEAIVYQKGIGDISCHATEQITVDSKGIGNVTYYGNPTKKEIKKKGVGSIIAR